ncbi:hypothetical protein [Xylophilus sp. ASV27]|uniref:hypothetical protein n=1 Tax=Xylophilus sp. ASV27 TaxID=2795129 RepID=UPI0018EC6523|nr:hypothetical protein [Xylophilus sp. ASV27]
MSNSSTSTTADVRGFSYSLAPFLHQQEWRMDKARNELARIQREITAVEAEREQLDAMTQNCAAELQCRFSSHADIDGYRRGLAYLALLRHRVMASQQRHGLLRSRRAELQSEVIAQQRKLDGLERHRADELQVYAQEIERIASAEADRDWIGRVKRPTLPLLVVREGHQ